MNRLKNNKNRTTETKIFSSIIASVPSNLELLHQLADGFAAGADDASMGPRVQVNVLAHHLLQLGHQLLDGLMRLLHVTLVPRDHDQILGGGESQIRKIKHVPFLFHPTSATKTASI